MPRWPGHGHWAREGCGGEVLGVGVSAREQLAVAGVAAGAADGEGPEACRGSVSAVDEEEGEEAVAERRLRRI